MCLFSGQWSIQETFRIPLQSFFQALKTWSGCQYILQCYLHLPTCICLFYNLLTSPSPPIPFYLVDRGSRLFWSKLRNTDVLCTHFIGHSVAVFIAITLDVNIISVNLLLLEDEDIGQPKLCCRCVKYFRT